MKGFITCIFHLIFLVEYEMVRACITYREGRNAYRDFMAKPGRKRALGRPRHRL
jgi:hypothetical protein